MRQNGKIRMNIGAQQRRADALRSDKKEVNYEIRICKCDPGSEQL